MSFTYSTFAPSNDKTRRSVGTKGNDLALRKLRDFAAKVDEAQVQFRKQGLSYGTPAICRIVAAGVAPRFYVYTHEALWQYSQYQKGLSRIHSDSKRRMYAEIFARYEHLMRIAEASGQRVLKSDVMTRVLEQEAPSFYYTPDVAPVMYYRYIRKRNKKRL